MSAAPTPSLDSMVKEASLGLGGLMKYGPVDLIFRCDNPECVNNHEKGGKSWRRTGEYRQDNQIHVVGGYCPECGRLGQAIYPDMYAGTYVVVEREP